jgi:carbamate kinase
MLIVAALGGNALLRRGEPLDTETQRRNVRGAAAAIAALAAEHRVVVTHGNGPQVGLLALQAESYTAVRPTPLDVLGAESEGMIGYLLEQEIANAAPGRAAATLLTQVEVDPNDPAFAAPTKPIGPVYGEAEARRLAAERGWTVARDGAQFRRVVASPAPIRILELAAIRHLVAAEIIVICAGGGGIPVAVSAGGAVRGVEAVIDKDRSASLLARTIGAEALLLLTDVDAVYRGWGTASPRRIRSASPEALRSLAFAPGSMGPKVEAACDFAAQTGKLAAIGALGDAAKLARGDAGTVIRRGAGRVAIDGETARVSRGPRRAPDRS